MADKFEFSLLEAGRTMQKGMITLAANVGKVTAIITLVVSALVLFTDVSFADFGAESFTSTLAVMLISSYLMYFSMSEAGERAGEDSEEYKSASARCTELGRQISGEKVSRLRDFCKSYSEAELKYRRESLITSHGYTFEEYLAAKEGAECPKGARRVFKRAARLRAVPLTPKMLLSRHGTRAKSELENPERSRLLHMILKLIPTTLCMTVTVSIMLTTKENMSATTVIDGIFKLSSLPVIGVRGYAAGYFYARYTAPLWLDTKSRLLEAFIKSTQ